MSALLTSMRSATLWKLSLRNLPKQVAKGGIGEGRSGSSHGAKQEASRRATAIKIATSAAKNTYYCTAQSDVRV